MIMRGEENIFRATQKGADNIIFELKGMARDMVEEEERN